MKYLIILIIIVISYLISPYLIGKGPDQEIKVKHHTEVSSIKDPVLDELRSKGDIDSLILLEEKLKYYLDQGNESVVSELISVNKKIYETNKDLKYLLKLADLSFELKVFSKAALLYQEYLTEKPEDLNVRNKYASCLIFLEENELAIQELNNILSVDSNNFSALAYIAIAYGQNKNIKLKEEYGQKALELAPNKEAKIRLKNFLKQPNSIDQIIKSHKIAGKHFIESTNTDGVVNLYFKDFPMSQMPEVAKEKFISTLTNQFNESKIKFKEIIFIDFTTNSVLYKTSK